MFYYVLNKYGTAGMGRSYGYARVCEEVKTYCNQTEGYYGPYTKEDAEMIAEEYNQIHDQYCDMVDGV